MVQYTKGEDGRWYYLASDNQWYLVPESDYAAQDDTTQDDRAEAGSFDGNDQDEAYEYETQPAGSSIASHAGAAEPWAPSEEGGRRRSRHRHKKDMKDTIDNIMTPMKRDSKKDDSKKSKDESKRRKKK